AAAKAPLFQDHSRQLLRIQQFERGEPTEAPPTPAEVLASLLQANGGTGASLDRLSRHESRLELTLHRCLRDLRRLQSDQNKPTDPPEPSVVLAPDPNEHANAQNKPTAPSSPNPQPRTPN